MSEPRSAAPIARRRSGERRSRRTRRVIIRRVDLAKRYQLGKHNFVDALRGATLDIARGEMAAIMGPSGFGQVDASCTSPAASTWRTRVRSGSTAAASTALSGTELAAHPRATRSASSSRAST